jgi:glycosyltransferase involved in cell wall biosynthesis
LNHRADQPGRREPRRVGIDLTALLPTPTGVDTYLQRLVEALASVDTTTRYHVFVNLEDRGLFAGRLPENFRVIGRCLRPRPVRLAFQQVLLPALAALYRFDVVHSPSFIMPMLRSGRRHLLTVYDMTFFSLPQHHVALRRSWPYRRAIVWSARRAHMITVPSESTRRELVRFVPSVKSSCVRVIAPGIGEEYRPCAEDQVALTRRRLGLERPYLLFLGTLEPRKNLERLVEAYARIVRERAVDEQLVLAGKPGWGIEPLLAKIRTLGLDERVRRLGYVAQEEVPALLSGARLFVYPSLAEGFGFPPLEAMACGVPTVAARSTSLTENLQGAAELVPPEDVTALADAMARVLADDELRARLRSRGIDRAARFRWQWTALETVRCYRELAEETESQMPEGSL